MRPGKNVMYPKFVCLYISSVSRYHMKRCVDSGLWCPNKEDPGTSAEDGFTVSSKQEDEAEEEVYEEVK